MLKFNRLTKGLAIIVSLYGIPFASQSTLIDFQTTQFVGTAKTLPHCRIEAVDNASAVVTIDIPAVLVSDATDNGIGFKRVAVQDFATSMEIGAPAVPVKNISMIVPENALLEVKVLEARSTVLDDILLHPALRQAAIRVDRTNEEPPFVMDTVQYRSNAFYPGKLASLVRTVKYRGVRIGQIRVAPLQCNPVTKQVRIYTHLKLALTLRGGAEALPGLSEAAIAGSLLRNVALNARPCLNRSGLSTKCVAGGSAEAPDIIMLTIPEFQAAAETLAVWHRMKGYNVKLVSRYFYDPQDVKDTVRAIYLAATPRPQYLLIIGDQEHVPAETRIDEYTEPFFSDLGFVCMDGVSDYVPEMARGRISVADPDQAMAVAAKIIGYEKHPPATAGFYKNVLSCAFFQDYYNGPDGYEDRAFVKVCEDVKIHLENRGYAGQRIYKAWESTNPRYWNNGYYSWGAEVPQYLRKPNFAWNGSGQDVNAAINRGCFLAYHYDHGCPAGWGDPDFGTYNINLSNGAMLPVVYSINCSSGSFGNNECFAEKLLRLPDGGAVAVVAASSTTYSGNNDALLVGMIDATWPGIKFANPDNPNPVIPEHEPIFTLGDILNQGLLAMSATWLDWGDSIHYQVYQLFGDPTTPIWTSQPQSINVSHDAEMSLNATDFALSGLDISRGTATLLDPRTKRLVGKAEIRGSEAVIPINEPFVSSGTVLLTITSHDCTPYSATIAVGKAAPGVAVRGTAARNAPVTLCLAAMPVATVTRAANATLNVGLYDCRGKLLYTRDLMPVHTVLHLPVAGLAAGLYFVHASVGGRVLLAQAVNHLR